MRKVDLHLHSNNSDGSDTLNDLLSLIKDNNISVFALTDHDTILACKTMENLVPDSINFINGIELTCSADKIKCHILGYNCDYNNSDLLALIEKGKILRKKKLDTRIEFLKNVWGIELTGEELAWLKSIPSVVKTHLGVILVNRKLAKNNIEAMDKYFAGCKTGSIRFDAKEAIDAIIASGGIPIWAHPLGGEGEEHISEQAFLDKIEIMKKIGIQGLECYYSRYSKKEIDFLVQYAKKNDLLISAGSDYHGRNKTVKIGQLSLDDIEVNYNDITLLNKLGIYV